MRANGLSESRFECGLGDRLAFAFESFRVFRAHLVSRIFRYSGRNTLFFGRVSNGTMYAQILCRRLALIVEYLKAYLLAFP
jgi:hypothetical protein